MYTLSLLLLTLFSLYIGVFAFFRWDASFLRNMNHAPVQALFILAFAVLLLRPCCCCGGSSTGSPNGI